MSKIHSIKIQNFKAIESLSIDFKGCTAIVTGGNNKGKSSFLRGIQDRIRFVRPDAKVRIGEKEGTGELVLDSGEKFIWEFSTEGKDKLTYITENGTKQNLTKELGERFFPETFDIDKFLQSPPKSQAAQLQKIIGIDFTEIDARYQQAYDDRTSKNRDAEKFHAKLSQMQIPEKVLPVDVSQLLVQKEAIRTKLNSQYLENKAKNDSLRSAYMAQKEAESVRFHAALQEMANREAVISTASRLHSELVSIGYNGAEVGLFIDNLPKPETVQEAIIIEPEYIVEMPDDSELQEIDKKLLSASETNSKAKAYKDFQAYKAEVDQAKMFAENADKAVKAIEAERLEMIRKANFPEGIEIRTDGIYVDGFPLDKTVISTSKLYCAALRIASIRLGEVKTLHFDASFLDKFTLSEIQDWASKNGLQLLIERPDFDGGEIQYQLIEG